jgi:hypothetical protein
MAIAKTLDILLRAPTGKLDKDFKDAQKVAAKFFGGIGTLAAAAFGGFTIANFIGRINTALNTLDETSKRALKLNVDISQVRGLELAADLSGLAVEKLTTSYAKLSKSIDMANKGGRTQQETFAKLGIDAEALGQLSLDKQFQAIAVGLDNVQDKTTKAAIAMELFGKGGLDLLPLLADGGQGIVAAMKDAQRLGGFISNQEAQSVEASNDAFTRLQFTLNAVFQKIAVDMAPALQRLWINLTEAIKPGTALNATIKTMGDVITSAVNVINEMAGFMSFLSQATGILTGKLLGGLIITFALAKAYGIMAAALTLLRVRTIALAAVEAARVAIQKKNLAMSLAVAGLGVAAFVAFSDQINGLVDRLLGVADAQSQVNDEVGDFAKLQSSVSAKANLGSASFGSQAALEQLLTVRTERQGIQQVTGAVKEGNEILAQIRDGLRGAAGVVGGFDFDEVDL